MNDIYLKQNGKCAFTKKDLTFNYTNKAKKYNGSINTIKNTKDINDYNISINRINNDKSYDYNNVELIACRINLMKNNLSNNNFIKLCDYVIKNSNTYK